MMKQRESVMYAPMCRYAESAMASPNCNDLDWSARLMLYALCFQAEAGKAATTLKHLVRETGLNKTCAKQALHDIARIGFCQITYDAAKDTVIADFRTSGPSRIVYAQRGQAREEAT